MQQPAKRTKPKPKPKPSSYHRNRKRKPSRCFCARKKGCTCVAVVCGRFPWLATVRTRAGPRRWCSTSWTLGSYGKVGKWRRCWGRVWGRREGVSFLCASRLEVYLAFSRTFSSLLLFASPSVREDLRLAFLNELPVAFARHVVKKRRQSKSDVAATTAFVAHTPSHGTHAASLEKTF
jgi:hypothetical protein